MTAQETNLINAFETTLTGTIGASDLTMTVNSVTDSASNTLAAPCYLVLNPDSATNREVVLVTSINSGTKTLTLDNINKRYLTGSAATSGLSHASGSVVRMSPLQQHIEDINDRVDTVINEAGTALNTTLFLDEDDMSSNSATKGVTQQSVKAYVDTQLTAEDLDISADSGSNIAIDLDSEVLDLEGGTGIDTTTGTNKVTFAIDSTVATLTGSQALTNKTIDVDSNTVSNIEVDNLKSGVLDTDLSSVSGSDDTLASAKAIKTYVDTQITAEDLDVTADSGGPISIDLDSETLDIAGGTGIDTTASGNEISIAIDSTVVTESSTDTLTNKTIDADNNTVSNLEVDNLKSGVLDTDISTTAATDTTIPSAKAVKTYVDAQGTAQDLDITDGSTTSAVDLDSQTMTIEGTSNEVSVGLSGQTFTIGLPSSITVNVTGNVTGNVSGSSGSTTGNAATATALETARNIGGVSFDGTGNIDLPGVNSAGNQNTSGTAAGLSATLAVASGGTGATSMTDKAVVITQDSGTDTLSSVAMDADGELLIGGTSGPAVSTLTAGTGITITNADGSITIAAPDVGDITGVTAGTGLSGGGTSGAVTLNVEASQAITALTGGDLTIYEDANNADVSLKMGTSAAESLTIEVLNGSGNKTAEQINFTTATASGTANHGKMVFAVDETTIATIDDGGIDLASGLEFSVNGTAIGGSAGALIDGDSDFTLSDGVANGIHYELDNTDMADWNQAGVVLTTAGGIFQHHQTQAATYSVPASTGAVLAGPITITGTITNNGTMVVI